MSHYTDFTRNAQVNVRVGGIILDNVVGGSISFSLDAPVPTAEIDLAGAIQGWIERGASVEIDWIYDGSSYRVFTGYIKRRRREPGEGRLECTGKTSRLYRAFQVEPRIYENETAENIVTEILNDVGGITYQLDIVEWTLGTVQPATLDLSSPGDAIQHVIEVDGHRQYELPSGVFVVRPLLEVPAPSPFRTYKTTAGSNPRILDISDDEDEDQVKKKVYVLGAVLETTDAEGNVTQSQIGGDPPVVAETLSDDLVEGDSELHSMQFSNDLIDTAAKAGEVALRLLDKFHRIVERVTFSAPLDPEIQLAQTIGLEDNAVTGRVVNWFVNGYRHSWGPNKAETELDLIGGDQSGTTGLLNPLADFVYLADREIMGTNEKVVITFVSAAFDLDGDIVLYHWTDDYSGGAMDVSGADLTVVTRVYDPAVDDSINVTLEVTDSDGLTGTHTKTISLSQGGSSGNADFFVPVIWCAAKNTFMCTPDGGLTWNDQSVPSGDAISVAAAHLVSPEDTGYGLFGTSTGHVYRSLDRLETAPTDVATLDGAVNHVWWDGRVPGVAWACTEPGSLYKSVDWGATWTQVLSSAVTGWPHNRIGTPGPIMVFLFGGDAADPSFSYFSLVRYSADGAQTWQSIGIGGELKTDLEANPNDNYEVIEAASGALGDLTIQLVGAGALNTRIYYTNDVWGAKGFEDSLTNLNEDLDASETDVDVVNAGTFSVDDIIKIDSEEMQITGITSNTLTVVRGYAGTTAATHTNGAVVYKAYFDFPWKRCTGDAVGLVNPRAIAPNEPGAGDYAAFFDTRDSYVTEDGVAYTENSLVLNDGVSAYHLLWVRGFKDLYFGAASDGIIKSADKLTTVDYIRPVAGISTWPGGAEGRMISFEMQPQGGTQEPDEVWAIVNIAGTLKLYKLAGTAWELVNAALGAGANRLKWIDDTLFYRNDAGLQRSINNGVNFSNVLPYPGLIKASGHPAPVKGSNGILWTTARVGALECIVKSGDDGATWGLSYVLPIGANNAQLWSIDVDPNNSQHIVAAGGGTLGHHTMMAYSLNGGTSWTFRDEPFTGLATEENVHMVWGQSQRLIVLHKTAGTVVKISVSDDYGASWTEKHTISNEGGGTAHYARHILRAGMWLWVCTETNLQSPNLARSNNNGETWEEIGSASDKDHMGASYHSDGDRLYLAVNNASTTADVERLMPCNGSDPHSTRKALNYNWGDLLGANTEPVQQGVSVKI